MQGIPGVGENSAPVLEEIKEKGLTETAGKTSGCGETPAAQTGHEFGDGDFAGSIARRGASGYF